MTEKKKKGPVPKFGGKSSTITIRVPVDKKQEIQIKIAKLLKPYIK